MKNSFVALLITSAFIVGVTLSPLSASITVTGSAAAKDSLKSILTAATGTTVSIDGSGSMTIAAGGNGCATILRKAINEATAVTLNVGRNLVGVVGGAFNPGVGGVSNGTQDIDLDDIEQFGTSNSNGNFSRGSALMHEIWEVIISVKEKKRFDDAHKKAIQECENGYYSAMSATPTVRDCGKDKSRPKNDAIIVVYVPFERGSDKKKGWSCIEVNVTSNQIISSPTFTENLPDSLTQTTTPIIIPNSYINGYDCSLIVPTVSEWGLIILSLLLLTLGTVVLYNRKSTLAGLNDSTIGIPQSIVFPPFERIVFIKILSTSLVIVIGGLATVSLFTLISATDVAGIIISTTIVAYMIHFWVVYSRDSKRE